MSHNNIKLCAQQVTSQIFLLEQAHKMRKLKKLTSWEAHKFCSKLTRWLTNWQAARVTRWQKDKMTEWLYDMMTKVGKSWQIHPMLMAVNESLYAINTPLLHLQIFSACFGQRSFGDWIHIEEQFEVVLIHCHSIKQVSLLLHLKICSSSFLTRWLNTSPTQRDFFWMYERKWKTIKDEWGGKDS